MHPILSLSFLALGVVAKCSSGGSSGTPANTTAPASSAVFQFSQPVDHFGLNDNRWNQQYLYNATFYKPGGPIFVLTPGENTLSNFYTDKTHFTSLAQSTSGLLVAVEHRFYGNSNPMPDLSGASLKYHTIENVLEDYASFIRTAKSNPSKLFAVPVDTNSKVIFAGGSYGGNIAAWMRAKYPSLVTGSWASSAVVYGRLLNYQFDQSYGRHLQSLGCAREYSQAVEDLDKILLSGNAEAIAEVQTKFGMPPLTPRDFAALAGYMGSAYAMAPVYVGDSPVSKNVCAFFNGTQSNLDSYAAVVTSAIAKQGLNQSALASMGDTSLNVDNYTLGQMSRVWLYQECTWSGNWQVAPPASTGLTRYRSQLVDLDYYEPNCQKKFGSDVKVPVDVAAYNRNWFDILKGVGNVYYTTGSVDIWRDSTVATSEGNLLPDTQNSLIYVIEGATHVQDFIRDHPGDLEGVKEARSLGDKLVLKWIS
ncbi:peptidase S28 [Martensiomyces pterosporus]|nr:peptidase S28 [Martensiomyces pterosporus]